MVKMQRRRFFEKKAQQLIVSYLFTEDEWDFRKLTMIRKKYLNNAFRSEIFLSSFKSLQDNIVGESAERLKTLFVGLQLHRRSLMKLKSSSWFLVIQGITELAEMGMKPYAYEISNYIDHKNPILSANAQIATIQLEFRRPFDFLENLKAPLSDWQQMELAHVSEQINKSTLPDFKKWLNNDEDSIVIFCIRMISLHQQLDAAQELIAMLKGRACSQDVLLALIFAVGQLELQETSRFLREIYVYEPRAVKEEILKTLKILEGEDSALFFESIINDKEIFHVQLNVL